MLGRARAANQPIAHFIRVKHNFNSKRPKGIDQFLLIPISGCVDYNTRHWKLSGSKQIFELPMTRVANLPDMLDNPKRHAINRRILQIDGLQKVPNGNREQHYMRTEVSKAVCLARQVKELQVGDEMKTRLAEHSRRMERLQKALEHLFEMRGRGVPRSPTAVRRVGLDRGIRGGEW